MTATLPAGLHKQLTVARETTFGVQSTATGQILRRTNESMNLSIDSFVNSEILPSGQYRDIRHGVNRPSGGFSGNLAPGAYTEFFQNILRQDFTATTPATSTGTIIAAANLTATTGTFTRSAGSFITDGHYVGSTVACTGWTTTAVANNACFYIITALTATVMTVIGAVVTKAAGDSVTIALQGHLTFMPAANQNDNSFTLERYFSDVSLVETFLGCKVSQISLNVPASGFITMSAMIMAQSMITTGTTTAYPTATALDINSAIDASTGDIQIALSGVPTGVVNVTGVQLQISRALQPQPVVGNEYVPYLVPGRLSVSGQITAYFSDVNYRNIFINEVVTSLTITASNGAAVNAPSMVFHMPTVKIQSADKTDGDGALFQTLSFTALENASGTAGTIPSTIMVQDTTA